MSLFTLAGGAGARAALAAFVLSTSGLAFAQARGGEPDVPAAPPQEAEVALPPAPADADLVGFKVAPTVQLRFAIDAKSLRVVNDEVRYTLVSQSAAGARNVSYEGLRCQAREFRTYAFGRPDGSWGRSRRDEWTPLVNALRAVPAQRSLGEDYFCRDGVVAGDVPAILDRMRREKRIWANNIND